jgi:hypothetical protein
MPIYEPGWKSDSHTPYKFAEQVPLTTKSFVDTGQPSRSIAHMKGLLSSSNPSKNGGGKYKHTIKHNTIERKERGDILYVVTMSPTPSLVLPIL